MSSNLLTLRLNDELSNKLEKLAQSTRRSKSFLAAEAIREYVSSNEWQAEEIKQAIKEADRGDFASQREVRKVFNKWLKHFGNQQKLRR